MYVHVQQNEINCPQLIFDGIFISFNHCTVRTKYVVGKTYASCPRVSLLPVELEGGAEGRVLHVLAHRQRGDDDDDEGQDQEEADGEPHLLLLSFSFSMCSQSLHSRSPTERD